MAKRKIFGLDISDSSIEAVLLGKSFKAPKVEAYARTTVRSSAAVNGIVKQPDKLAELIKELLASAQPKPIKTPYCILSIPDAQVFTAVFKFPAGLRRHEVMQTIPYKAEEIIPFKSSEIYFDFKTITVNGGTQEVFYVAVPKQVIDNYLAVLKKAGLVAVAIDVESVSLSRALINTADLNQGKGQESVAVLLADIGSRTTNLTIFDRHGVRENQTVATAGNRFTKALMTGLKLSEKEAKDIKMKVGLDLKQNNRAAVTTMQKEMAKLTTAAKKLVDFFQTENHRGVGTVILAGGSSLMPEISAYWTETVQLPTSVGNPLLKVSDPAKLIKLKKNAVLFSNSIGLALRALTKNPEAGDINLLPLTAKRLALMPEPKDHAAWRRVYVKLVTLVLLGLTLAGVLWLKKIGTDIYQLVFKQSNQPPVFTTTVDGAVLDALRQQLLLPETDEAPLEETEPAPPPRQVQIQQTTVGFLNVRQEPRTTAPKIGEAPSGQTYVLLSEIEDWYQIQFSTSTAGWVAATYVNLIEPSPTSTPAVPPTNAPAEPPASLGRVKIKDTNIGYLNVRQGPSTGSAKVGEALVGSEYDLLAEQTDWYQIKLSATVTGWVYSLYVDKLQ